MVPTMILFGLVFGRWWRAALVAAAVVWPALLVLSDAMTMERGLLIGSLIGLINAPVGVAVHQGVAALVRRMREPSQPERRSKPIDPLARCESLTRGGSEPRDTASPVRGCPIPANECGWISAEGTPGTSASTVSLVAAKPVADSRTTAFRRTPSHAT
ncbi:MAG: hypothetical protein M3O70_07175 [Actinomycetota bacterium]|nr:hypothetical protein [Actinomycetota bacterium]